MEKQINNTIERKFYITLLSVISAFSVVFLHTNGQFWSFSKEYYWFLEGINECIFYFAVPIFFMISGITLFDYTKRYSTYEYFKRRISKTVIPFIFWSIFGLFFHSYIINDLEISNVNFWSALDGILNTKYVEIYWFFIVLFKIYILIPLFANLKECVKNKLLIFLLLVMLITNSILPFFIDVYCLSIPIPQTFVVGDKLIIYCIIGYLADVYYESFLKNRKVFIIFTILGIVAFCCHLLGTYFLSLEANEIVTRFKGYANLLCIVYSFWIYLLVRRIELKLKSNIKIKNAIEYLSKYVFAIYLLHIFVLKYIIDVFKLDMNASITRWGLPFVVIPICMLIIYVLRKNKLLAKIVP